MNDVTTTVSVHVHLRGANIHYPQTFMHLGKLNGFLTVGDVKVYFTDFAQIIALAEAATELGRQWMADQIKEAA